MIIKSMPRKTSNFGQLYDYMLNNKHKADRDYIFKNNLYLNIDTQLDREKIINEFKRNYENIKQKNNGNALYHEIISIKKNNDLTDKEQKEILFDIVKNYVDVRAKDCLSYGIMHEEKDNNLHYHLMISSNGLSQEGRHFLSRNEFNTIQKNLEDYLISKHPQLKQEQVFNKTTNKQTKTRNEFEQEKRTGEKSQRSRVKETLEEVFRLSKTKEEFINNLKYTNLELYVRGQQIGFKDLTTNLKYRLNKIGLTKEFENLSKIIETQEKTQAEEKEQEKIKQQKAQAELKEQERIRQEKFYQDEAQAIWEEQERIERIKKEAEREINKEQERKKAEDMYKEAQAMRKEQERIRQQKAQAEEKEQERIKQEKEKQEKNSFFSKIGIGIEKTLGFIAGGDIYGRDRDPKEIYKKAQKEKKEREYKEKQAKREQEYKRQQEEWRKNKMDKEKQLKDELEKEQKARREQLEKIRKEATINKSNDRDRGGRSR